MRPSCLAVLSQWTALGASTHFTCESKLLPMDTFVLPPRVQDFGFPVRWHRRTKSMPQPSGESVLLAQIWFPWL